MFKTGVFVPDDQYDRDHASDFQSRYGAYLRQNLALFTDGDEGLTNNPLEFAAAAWRVAQGPVMCPPYVTAQPRILETSESWDAIRQLAIRVDVAVDLPRELSRSLRGGWVGWRKDRYWDVPTDYDRPIATAVLHFHIPMPADGLPAPRYSAMGEPAAETAKRAVAIVCGRINTALDGVFARFDRQEVA